MNIDNLKSYKLIYLATPYSKFPGGIEKGFEAASKIAGRMVVHGISVYSPIAHTHPLAIYGDVDPYDHSVWLPFDETMMRLSDACVVAMLPTWEISRGVAHEIEVFKAAGKPVIYAGEADLDTL